MISLVEREPPLGLTKLVVQLVCATVEVWEVAIWPMLLSIPMNHPRPSFVSVFEETCYGKLLAKESQRWNETVLGE